MKKSEKKKYLYLLGSLIVLAVILGTMLIVVNANSKEEELNKIYSTFTCNCCEKSLYGEDDFCAIGIREEIEDMQESGLSGEALFEEVVSLLGIHNIIDYDFRIETFQEMQTDLPEDRAKIQMDETSVDFGNVSESEVSYVIKEFSLRNVGREDLYIYQVKTSCSCLTAKFVSDTWESPAYGRFSNPHGMTVKVEPQEKIRVRVVYDARINSFFRGHEVRYVYLQTNDLEHPTVQLDIEVTHVD